MCSEKWKMQFEAITSKIKNEMQKGKFLATRAHPWKLPVASNLPFRWTLHISKQEFYKGNPIFWTAFYLLEQLLQRAVVFLKVDRLFESTPLEDFVGERGFICLNQNACALKHLLCAFRVEDICFEEDNSINSRLVNHFPF